MALAFYFVDGDGDPAHEFFEEGPEGLLVRVQPETLQGTPGKLDAPPWTLFSPLGCKPTGAAAPQAAAAEPEFPDLAAQRKRKKAKDKEKKGSKRSAEGDSQEDGRKSTKVDENA